MKMVRLRNGVDMPAIAYGCWHLDPGVETVEAVSLAIEGGYRSIDAAYSYGNDYYVGKAVKRSGVPRSQLFVSNKVWNTFRGEVKTIECCKRSLRLMKLDHFDLYLIHWPAPATLDGWREINLSTWKGMERLYEDGFVRSIGVSNFEIHHLEGLKSLGVGILPMVNQIEFHPGCFPESLLSYCQQNGIVVEGWSPLGNGEVLGNPTIRHLAQKYGCSPAQICLSWAMEKGVIPIPRSKVGARMKENLLSESVHIDRDDTRVIDSLAGIGLSSYSADGNQPD